MKRFDMFDCMYFLGNNLFQFFEIKKNNILPEKYYFLCTQK